MTTYVLIGGAWIGAWAWRDVTDALRQKRHQVYPLSLTGLAERVHLATAETNLDTHIADVVNLFEYEDLQDVVLVGHSYAGAVVTGAADRAAERLKALVYCSANKQASVGWMTPRAAACRTRPSPTHSARGRSRSGSHAPHPPTTRRW
jgi:pimeloyl-ACP methyl ester carboxylesterase